MADIRYHIGIVRSGRRSLTAWAQRKAKPRWLDYAPCGECGETVTGVAPNIEEAEEYIDGMVTYRGADLIRDISLLPCEHLVDRFVYALEGSEHALVDDILQFEREDRP